MAKAKLGAKLPAPRRDAAARRAQMKTDPKLLAAQKIRPQHRKNGWETGKRKRAVPRAPVKLGAKPATVGNPSSMSLSLLRSLAAMRAEKSIVTPLDYMLWTLNAPGNRFSKKDKQWAAQAAAPYIHARRIEVTGDPAKPVVVAVANQLRNLSNEEFAQLRDMSRKLNEKVIEAEVIERDVSAKN